jgi:hypothetical protein
MARTKSKFELSAAIAARSALITTATVLVLVGLRAILNTAFGLRRQVDWGLALGPAAIVGLGSFLLIFFRTHRTLSASDPVDKILSHEPPTPDKHTTPLSGFVAMEYYDLILNRTYVVFIAPEGLYGWKAQGPVAAGQPKYFVPYSEMLKDSDLMNNRRAVKRLSDLAGGFFIPRSDILSADVIGGKKWGMGSIPQSGRVKIRTVSGKSRELILLGQVDAVSIQQSILGFPASPTGT